MKLSTPAGVEGPVNWFFDLVRLADSLADKVGVLLVANVQGRTKPVDDYADGDSIISEFLTSQELDHFIEGFQQAGIYCQTVLDEAGFLEWLDSERSRFPREHSLVYNLAQNGTGPARLCLVPGMCRLYGIPLVDSDGYGVAIAQHKFHSSSVLRQCGLPAARSWWFTQRGWWPTVPAEGSHLIAKLTYESASIGMGADSIFVMSPGIESILLRLVEIYRQPLTVQEFVEGFEIEVPVFDADEPRTVIAVGIEANGKRDLGDTVLVYEQVATDRYSFYDFANEQPSSAVEMTEIAREAFRGLGLRGIGRVDFRLPVGGRPVIIEVNCKPHLTRHSSFAYAVNHVGGCHADLLKFLVGATAARCRISD